MLGRDSSLNPRHNTNGLHGSVHVYRSSVEDGDSVEHRLVQMVVGMTALKQDAQLCKNSDSYSRGFTGAQT